MCTNSDQHFKKLTEGLFDLYTCDILTDVTLVADHVHIKCHRNVLAASSPYFRAMFTNPVKERDEEMVVLHNVDPTLLKAIVDFMYTGNVEINNDNVQDIFITASMFEMIQLIGRCTDHMIEQVCITNCVEVFVFATHFACTKMRQFARTFILEHFSDMIQDNDRVFDLDIADFEDIIASDELSVEKEETVFDVIMQWTLQGDRRGHFSMLFKHVRLVLLGEAFFNERVLGNPHIMGDPLCNKHISMFNSYKLTMSSSESLQDAETELDIKHFDFDNYDFNTKPRHGMFNRTMLVFSGGAYAADERSFTAFDPVSLKNFVSLKPHPTFDFKYKVDFYQLVTTPDNSIFFIGGIFYDNHHFEDFGQTLRDVYQYNMKEIKWEKKACLNTRRCCFSASVHENSIFVVGGKPSYPRGEPTDSVEMYNVEHDMWISLSPFPIKIYNHASSATKDAIFVFGGKDEDDDYLDTVFRYDISRDSWTLVTTSMAKPRAQFSAFYYKARILLVGGVSVHENILTVAIYDPDRNTWSHGDDFPEERKMITATFHDGTIFVCGGVRHLGISGRRSRKVETRDLFQYNIDKNSWRKVVKLVQYGNSQSATVAILNTKYLQESEFISSN